MFEIEVYAARQIALVRFRGEITEQDLATLDLLAGQRARVDYDTIIDLTEVEKSTLTTDLVSRRGELPRLFKDRERIYVVQQADLKLLIRLFVAYQEAKGWKLPIVVETLTEALQRLQVTASDFEPVTLSPSRG